MDFHAQCKKYSKDRHYTVKNFQIVKFCQIVALYKNHRKQYVRKSLVICATHLAGGLLLKILKYFKVMLNIFEFSHVKKIIES